MKQKIKDSIISGFDIDYTHQRRSNYPHIGDQLDMLWHAMDEGDLPIIEPFYSEIQDVKVKYPPVTTITGTYGAIIADGEVINIVKWDKEQFPEYPIDHFNGDGIVEITQEVVDYVGFVPKAGDKFNTIGTAYTVPPGAFISSDQG